MGWSLRVERWGRRLSLEPLDLWFLALRIATLIAGLTWWWLAREVVRAPLLPILGGFILFSVALYWLNALIPGRIELFYRAALVFDLALVFLLVRITGGFHSDLYLAFVLLIALHAFYFGLLTGVGAAGAAIALYVATGDWPPPMPAFALRCAFFALVGVCMGVLAEQARRRREALERQQEQLLRSDRLATVGELAAGLAHELRNPLAGMSGALHVLAGQLGPDDDRRALFDDLQAQIARMNQTLTDLLRHARPAVPARVGADVTAVVEQSLTFVPRAGLEIVRRYDPGLPAVLGDPNLLHQAFLNVLVNARQAMPAGGRLTIETRRAGERDVEVRIADTGEGIAHDLVSRIFLPFFTTKAQGTGLGLAIAARIVEQHDGRIAVDTAVGRGTTFTITLPVMRATAQPDTGESYAFESAGR